MPRMKELRDMEIDEISLVDRPANQHAKVVITKRATEEDIVPEEIYNEDGELLDAESLEEGDVVFDNDGEAFVVVDEETEDSQEFEEVGKGIKFTGEGALAGARFKPGVKFRAGAFKGRHTNPKVGFKGEGEMKNARLKSRLRDRVKKSFTEELREELSKSYTDEDRDNVIAKAMGQVEEMAQSLAEAEEIAKSERDLRLTREYEEVAKSYNLPIDAEDLAPVLMAIAEELPYEYGEVIHKALSAAGEILFEEMGVQGAADNNDVLRQVDEFIDTNVSKTDISKAQAIEAVFAENPQAYDEYMATRY